jgi:hypothetical protein
LVVRRWRKAKTGRLKLGPRGSSGAGQSLSGQTRLAISRTMKDRAGKQSIPNTYEIIRRADRSFDIFHNGESRDRSIRDEWLEDQLVKYGICGQEYRDARRELDEFGKIKLEYGSGWIETKLMEVKLKSKVKKSHRSKGI